MSPHEFEALYAAVQALEQSRFTPRAAMATLVRTQGPTFRRAGARMLVFEDGRIVKGISAGCPEADIAARACEALQRGASCLLRYGRDYGYDTLLELGCGGEMDVLLEPLREGPELDYLHGIAELLQHRREGRLLTVFAAGGRGLSMPQRLLWDGAVKVNGVADPQLQNLLIARLECAPAETSPATWSMDAHPDQPMVLVEAIQPVLSLVLIGSGEVAASLARLGRSVGWAVTLVSPTDAGGDEALPPEVNRRHLPPQVVAAQLRPDQRTAVVVMTHNLENDQAYLRALARVPLAYLGALGSRQRADRLRAAVGVSDTPLCVPAGLDIGSETPEEIALSIAAEIQSCSRRRSGGPLSLQAGPIH